MNFALDGVFLAASRLHADCAGETSHEKFIAMHGGPSVRKHTRPNNDYVGVRWALKLLSEGSPQPFSSQFLPGTLEVKSIPLVECSERRLY